MEICKTAVLMKAMRELLEYTYNTNRTHSHARKRDLRDKVGVGAGTSAFSIDPKSATSRFRAFSETKVETEKRDLRDSLGERRERT